MHEVKVRHTTNDDIEAIKTIYEGEAAYSGTLQLPFPSLDKWTKRLLDLPKDYFSLAAEIEEEIVGHIGLQIAPSLRRKHVGQIGLAVKDAHHGRGIGGKLMGAAIDLAENWLNISRVELTVFVDNDRAIALYKKHDFQIEGRAVNYAFRNGKYVDVYHMARIRSD